MQPIDLIPAPDAIPVTWGWLEALLLGTFVVHLLLMNAVVGGVIISVVRGISKRNCMATREFSHVLPTVLALTINFGVAPLLFVQMLYGQFLYTSSVLMAAYWLAVVFIVIAAYYGLYIFGHQYAADATRKRADWVLRVVAVLLFVVGFIMSNNMTLMLRPDAWYAYFNTPNGTILNTDDPSLPMRYMHMMLSAVAIGGLTQAVLFTVKQRKETDADKLTAMQEHVRFGMRWFTVVTAVQLMVGALFLSTLEPRVGSLFMGDSEFHTGALIIAIAGVAIALHYSVRNRVWPTVAGVVFTVTAMAFVRALVRAAYLEPYFSVEKLPVNPEYSPMVIFFVSLAAGLGCIGYMLKLVQRGKEEV